MYVYKAAVCPSCVFYIKVMEIDIVDKSVLKLHTHFDTDKSVPETRALSSLLIEGAICDKCH